MMSKPSVTPPLHIVHIASGDLWAGAESQLYSLILGLRRTTDVELSIILLNKGELSKRLVSSGLPVTILNESEMSSWQIFFKLCIELLRLRPSVVHTHRIKENILGSFASLFVPHTCSIRTTHGAPETTTKRLSAARMLQCIDRFVGRHIQRRTVAVSRHLQGAIARTFGRDRAVCIPNGIDVSETREQALAPPSLILQGTVKIGFVGRLTRVKRIDVILQVAQILRDRAPGMYQFYIIGDGPLREPLESTSRHLQLTEMCHFLGFFENCLPLLRQMDTTILTSDHEGLPMVALESLALGVPVICHATGGLPEVINSAARGVLIPTQNPADYANAIHQRFGNEVNRPTYCLLPDEFKIEHCAYLYDHLYKELMHRGR